MEAQDFEESNVVFAKDQPQYNPLHAFLNQKTGSATFKFKLSEEEVKQVEETGEIYLTVLTFGKPLQPIHGSCLNPFKDGGQGEREGVNG